MTLATFSYNQLVTYLDLYIRTRNWAPLGFWQSVTAASFLTLDLETNIISLIHVEPIASRLSQPQSRLCYPSAFATTFSIYSNPSLA